MDADARWTRIRELFDAAVELPADRRAAFLARACGADMDLRREVDSLLEADDGATEALPDGVAPDLVRQALGAAAPEELIGQRIGSYTIRAVLGAGGMGTVFEAEQDQPRRLVALKVMRAGRFSERVRRRFEYEAEILARLRHPGIAQIHAAATFEVSGRSVPYFAMELIDGALPLDAFVESSQLGLRDRLELFRAICEAVDDAHRRGVIHRDLKPGNILVDRQGQPKLIDFGIARPTADSEELRSLHTETGMVLGTMRYMSPEQMDGDAEVDVRTDVYALGVILYELLTDTAPVDTRGRTIHVMAQLIRTAPVEWPSVRRPGLAEDLDWIAMRAIAKERRERYGSVGALAEDVRRFLADEPVLAGRPGRLYQLRKFVRRHRAGVAAAVTVVVAMVAGTVISVAAMLQAQAAEDVARRAQARTEKEKKHVAAVNGFLLDMIAEADPSRAGKAARVRDVLDSAAEKLAGFAPDDPELNLHLQATVTTSYFGLGEYRPALKLLDAAVPRARRELGPKHPLTLSLINNQGLCLRRIGRLEDAEPLLREALAGRREVLAPDDSYIADSLINLATLQEKRGEFADALALYREAHRIRVADKGENSQGALRTLSSMAIVHERMGDAETALRCARQAYAPCVELFGRDHRTTQGTANNLASILRATGAYAEAAEIFRQLLESHRKRYEPHHPTVLRTMNNLATALKELGRRKEAIDLLRQIEGLRKGAGNRVEALIAANNLAATLRDDGQLEEAEARFRAVLEESQVLGNERHWLVGVFRKGYGCCLLRMRRLPEAERELQLGVEILAEKFGDADRRAHDALEALAELYTEKGEAERAAALAPRLAAHKGGR